MLSDRGDQELRKGVCVTCDPYRKNLFLKNIFASYEWRSQRCHCVMPLLHQFANPLAYEGEACVVRYLSGVLCAHAELRNRHFQRRFRVRRRRTTLAPPRKSETARAELLRQRAVRKTERRAALRRTLGFSKKSSDCFRQFEKNRTRKGINNVARKVAPFRSGTQFVACDLSR